MSSILVVSADAEQRERIEAALVADGHRITQVGDRQHALRAAADQAPDLVVVDAEIAGASDLATSFRTDSGGPGSLLVGGEGSPAGDADAVLPSMDSGPLVETVRRLLSAPRSSSPGVTPTEGRRLSAEDIFGDIVREIEGLGSGPGPSPPEPRRAPAAVAAVPREAPPKEPHRSVPALVPPPAAMAPESDIVLADGPHRFGHYELEERIAVGGMAEIWKARMTGVEGFEKTVAIKKILPHLTESEDFEKMFVEEAKLAARLNHENIIHIYDLGKINEQYFIAMEFVEGKDLRSIVNGSNRLGVPIPTGLILLVGARLASALEYAHRHPDADGVPQGLVHRDVSPRNILVGYDGRIKLCDFGVAKVASSVVQTQFGAIKGKIQYMSPEQAWGKTVDGRSDIFSLGAVLFEMATGQRLFGGDTEISLLEAVRECRVRDPREVEPGIPEQLAAVIRRALRKSPDDRYDSAAEMQRELEGFLYSLRPAPGGDDLSRYLESLFEPKVPAPAPVEAADPAAVGTPVEPAVSDESASGETAESAEAARSASWLDEADRSAKREKRLRYGLAALVLVILAAVAALVYLGSREADETPPPAAPVTALPEALESGEPTEVIPPPAEEVADPPATRAAAPTEAPPLDDDLEDLVSRELARREAELRRLFQDQEQTLLEELEQLREPDEEAAGPPPAGEGAGSGDGPPGG